MTPLLPAFAPRERRGGALVELLVALPLVALLGALAVALLLAVHRQGSGTDGRLGATRELRHAAAALAGELRPLRPVDLIAWSDTSIEFDGTVLTGTACATRDNRTAVNVLDARNTNAAAAAVSSAPQPGDDALVTTTGPAGRHGAIVGATVSAVGTSADCTGVPAAAPGGAIRLDLAGALPSAARDGSAVRVSRRTRYSLYRAPDGEWFLGRRTRAGTVWETIQPVAGPLHSAAARGLRIVVRDGSGSELSALSAAARLVSITMRAPRADRRARAAGTDSTAIAVALRGAPPP